MELLRSWRFRRPFSGSSRSWVPLLFHCSLFEFPTPSFNIWRSFERQLMPPTLTFSFLDYRTHQVAFSSFSGNGHPRDGLHRFDRGARSPRRRGQDARASRQGHLFLHLSFPPITFDFAFACRLCFVNRVTLVRFSRVCAAVRLSPLRSSLPRTSRAK